MPNTHVPAAGGALPAAQPTIFLTVTPDLRLKLATTIENLIALLDTIDGDENLEESLDDEPGTWTEFHQSRGHTLVDDENLEDNGDGEPDADAEPDDEPEDGSDAEEEMWAERCGQGHDEWVRNHLQPVSPC